MNKYLIVLVVSALIVPQVALASWWNPLSWSIWNIFQKTDTKTQELENHTNELQGKLGSLASSTVATSTATTSVDFKPKPAAVVPKTILKPVVAQSQPPQTPEATPTTIAPPELVVFDACKNIEGVQALAPVGMYSDSGNCLSNSNLTQTQVTSSNILEVTQPQKSYYHIQIIQVPPLNKIKLTNGIVTFTFKITNNNPEILTITGANLIVEPGETITGWSSRISINGDTGYLDNTLLSTMPELMKNGTDVTFTTKPISVMPYSSATFSINLFDLFIGQDQTMALTVSKLYSPTTNIVFDSVPTRMVLNNF